MKRAAIAGAVLLAITILLVTWERSKWIQQRNAQCDSAAPLIRDTASRQQITDALGKPSSEYGREDWPDIERHFSTAQQGDKLRDISQRLHDRGRLLVYSRSNSIMFLYANA